MFLMTICFSLTLGLSLNLQAETPAAGAPPQEGFNDVYPIAPQSYDSEGGKVIVAFTSPAKKKNPLLNKAKARCEGILAIAS